MLEQCGGELRGQTFNQTESDETKTLVLDHDGSSFLDRMCKI